MPKKTKGVAWYIPPRLRHWLNSHASYLSAIGPEISTDEMVVEWLKERVKSEERKRDVAKLERAVEREEDENRQRTVRPGSTLDAGQATPENVRNKGRGKGSHQKA